MGWGRMLLLGDLGQQLDIHDTRTELAQLHDRLRATGQFDREVAKRLDLLATENAELKLYLAAVVRLLVAKGVVGADELKQIVDVIDRSDGRSDGQLNGQFPPA
jgi:hypothetical protein